MMDVRLVRWRVLGMVRRRRHLVVSLQRHVERWAHTHSGTALSGGKHIGDDATVNQRCMHYETDKPGIELPSPVRRNFR